MCHSLVSLLLLPLVIGGGYYKWGLSLLTLGSAILRLEFSLDYYSILFGLVISTIGLSVSFFSRDYMKENLDQDRFVKLVSFFILSMLCLVYMPFFPSVFIGWELLGLSSFLLVSFYSTARASSGASLTFLTSRVGDYLLIIVLCLVLGSSGGAELSFFSNLGLGLVGILLMSAMFTKSAQTPFSAWLPAAMVAPTPVSALVHSSTLVTAGVYIFLRNGGVFSSPLLMKFILVISGLTMVLSGLVALMEKDVKRIVALSTLSQLGFMFFCLGLGLYDVAYAHMITHALVKALLFVCVGRTIEQNSHCQHVNLLGGSLTRSPVCFGFMMFSLFGLMGLPFLGAYFTKHAVLVSLKSCNIPIIISFIFYLGSALTIAYSVRICLSLGGSLINSGCSSAMWLRKKIGWSELSMGILAFSLLIICPGLIYVISSSFPFESDVKSTGGSLLYPMSMLAGLTFGSIFFAKEYKTPSLDFFFHKDLTNKTKEEVVQSSERLCSELDRGWLEFIGPAGLRDLWENIMIWVNKPPHQK
nr:NADH dehydrogenase subunit 5 [Glottidia pyramidata]